MQNSSWAINLNYSFWLLILASEASNISSELTANASKSAFGQVMFFEYDTHQSWVQCHRVKKDQGKVSWCNLSSTVVVSAGPAPPSCTSRGSQQIPPKLPRHFLRFVFLKILGNCQAQFTAGFRVGAHGTVYGDYLGHHILVKSLHSYTVSSAHHTCHLLFQLVWLA